MLIVKYKGGNSACYGNVNSAEINVYTGRVYIHQNCGFYKADSSEEWFNNTEDECLLLQDVLRIYADGQLIYDNSDDGYNFRD